jgi:hypothetical protein
LAAGKYEHYRLTLSANSLKVFLEHGQSGSVNGSNSFLDTITIANAADLNGTNFACSISNVGLQTFQSLNATYNSVNQTLSLTNSTAGGLLDISEIRQIYYGNNATDLNLCSPDSYTYVIGANQTILLNGTAASFTLTHKTARLPDLMVNLQLIGEQIVNFNITLANKNSSSRSHTAVDIGAVPLDLSMNN